MITPARIVSLVMLSLVMIPCLLYFAGTISLDVVKWTALFGTVGWFIATPTWMSRKLPVDENQVEI